MGVLPKEQLLSPEYEVDYDQEAMVRSTVILNQPNRADNGINHDENNQDRSTNDTPHVYTIDNIQMGCVYDVLDSMNRWCEGEIIKIDKRNQRVYVSYVYWDSDQDEWVDNIPDRIAPKHTHTYIEGGVLKLRQRVEALDERGEWLQAFVVAEEADKVQVHFKGYAHKFDRWIRRDEAPGNIRPFGRMRLHLKHLQEFRRRDFLNNSNMKWSVPGMKDAVLSASKPRLKSTVSQNNNDTNNNNSSSNAMIYEESKDGHNYGRERIVCVENDERTRKIADLSDKFHHYLSALERHALRIVRVSGDGNCLFRSVAHQIYGDESLHGLVREKCMDYMEAEAEFFSLFVVGGRETFHLYLHAKRQDGCWGDDPEIEAICELYDRPAEIWAYDPVLGARKLRTFHESAGTQHGGYTAVSRQHSSGGTRHRSNQDDDDDDEDETDTRHDQHQMMVVDPADDQEQSTRHSVVSSVISSREHHPVSLSPSSPVIRLSYYGGGHYDSLVSDIDHLAGLIRDTPGAWEDSRIRQSKRFHAESRRSQSLLTWPQQQQPSHYPQDTTPLSLQTPSSQTLSQRHRTQWQLNAAQQAKAQEEEQVIRLSQEQARQREETDLETTLLLSLQQHQDLQARQDDEKEVLQMIVQESKQEYEKWQQEYAAGAKGDDNVDDEEDVLLALALAQSKDHVSRGLSQGYKGGEESSFIASEQPQHKAEDAKDRGDVVSHLSDEEALRVAIAQSLQTPALSSSTSFPSTAGTNNAQHANTFPAQYLEDEDALLQQALAESLTHSQQQQQQQVHHTVHMPHSTENNNVFATEFLEDDDPELFLAIQESLRK